MLFLAELAENTEQCSKEFAALLPDINLSVQKLYFITIRTFSWFFFFLCSFAESFFQSPKKVSDINYKM